MSPFDTRLPRIPYLVLPKLALQAMPLEWQEKFERLLAEMEESGIRTPDYYVFRNLDDGNPDMIRGCRQVNRDRRDGRAFYRLTGGYNEDPWANYRHGDAKELS